MVSFQQLKNSLFFLVGFAFGLCIYILSFTNVENYARIRGANIRIYNESLAEQLFDEVKVLCMIMTNPNNHKTRAIHVRDTWGKRCNKLLFITTQDDPEFETIIVHVNESRMALRRKTKTAFLYAHDNHLDDFDWFLKADDDKYV